MRTFAQKQNQPQKPVSSSFPRSNTAILGPNHHVNPVLDLQRTIGNQAVQRPLRTSGEELKAGLNGMASPLFGHDFSRIHIHPPAAATQPKLKVGEPNDKFEQEADQVADKVMKMPEPLSPVAAISTSASVHPSSAIQPHCVECARGGGRSPRCVEKEKLESNVLTETTNALIQRKPGDVDEPTNQMSRKKEDKKAELEFHSTIAFNSTNSGSSSTGPSKEGFTFLEIQWVVWNTGWETAPEHVDRLTIYKADRCSGCRDEKDEILSAEVTAPATVPITQPDEGKFRYESITPMVGMTMRAGHYDVYVDLDVYDEVEEINKDNNTIFTSFVVKPRNKSEPDTEGEEEIIQKKDAGPALDAGPDVESQISDLKAGGQPLPQSLRDFFEPRFGYDFSRVRIHSDARAAKSGKNLQAKAFTVGRDIVFGESQYAVEKPEGRHLLAHELAHVVQQTKTTSFNELRPVPFKDEA